MVKLCPQFLENHRDSMRITTRARAALPDRAGVAQARSCAIVRPPRGGTAMQELNPAKLALLFRREFALCAVKPGETIALLSDLQARAEYVAAAFAAAEDLGDDIYEMKVNAVPSWTRVGIETVGACKGTVAALAAADLLVCLHVPLFTKWMKTVRDAGTRVLMVIDAPDDLEQLMAPPDLKDA